MPITTKYKGFDADFDFYWKEILDLVEPATLFFLPELHHEVDWSIDYKSLEQELRGPFSGRKGKVKRTDKLFRLRLKDGTDRFILFHIEAEAYPDNGFPQRIFEYYAYLSVKFGFTPIAVLGIFVGDKPPESFDRFVVGQYGTHLELRFQTRNITDWEEDTLLTSENPFALAVLANLYVIKSKGNPSVRMALKRKLVMLLMEREISLDKFRAIINFALLFVRLPEKEEIAFSTFIKEQIAKKDKSDMGNSGKEQVTDYVEMMIDTAFQVRLGVSKEEMFSQIEELIRKSEEDIRKSEESIRESEEKMRESEEKMRNSEEKMRKSVLNLHKKLHLNAAQIASTLELDLAWVKQILEKR